MAAPRTGHPAHLFESPRDRSGDFRRAKIADADVNVIVCSINGLAGAAHEPSPIPDDHRAHMDVARNTPPSPDRPAGA
jgi:hypothetical protein